MDDVKGFLRKQKLLVLSTIDKDGNPWSCNVYYSTNDKLGLFFDDSQSIVDSATKASIDGHLFDGLAEFKRVLAQKGVDV